MRCCGTCGTCGSTSGFLSGEVSSLLGGGVLKGEARRSVNSAAISGAAKLLDFLTRVGGLTGTFGFAARFTVGGPGFSAFGSCASS